MIEVHVLLHGGLLEFFSAEGHAGRGIKGTNIVCAAATILLRTAVRSISSQDDIESCAEAAAPGEMSLRVTAVPPEKILWLKGVTDLLLAGLKDLEFEYPDEVRLITASI